MAASLLRFFHPVATSASLGKAPRAVSIADDRFVVFRDGRGRPAILRDRCPHRFAPLSKGRIDREGNLACAYHGWTFDRDGRGRSPTQPSLGHCDVEAFQAVERFGCVWLAARDAPIDRFPSMGWEGFEFGGVFDMLFQAPLHVALDNFSEDEHTPFVHTRLGWDASQVGDVTFSAHRFDDRTEVHYTAPQRSSRLVYALGLRPGDLFHNDWVTRFDPVRTDYTISWSCATTGEPRPVVTRAVIFMVPETDRTTRFFVFSFVKLVDPRLRPLLPLVKRAARWLGWYEVRDDARFIPTVADTPLSMKGMRLGRFDEPLIHNHKLLERIYYGRSAVDLPVVKDVEIAR